MKVFIICPVRNASPEQKDRLEAVVAEAEAAGIKVHYPPRDTPQTPPIGVTFSGVLITNANAIIDADEVWIFYDPTSEGSRFDLGALVMANLMRQRQGLGGKKFRIINPEDLKLTEGMSFDNSIWEFTEEGRKPDILARPNTEK